MDLMVKLVDREVTNSAVNTRGSLRMLCAFTEYGVHSVMATHSIDDAEAMSDKHQGLLTELIIEMRSLRIAMECQEEAHNKYNRPMTREEAAEYLKIHPDTLYKWAVEDGRIAYSRLGEGERAPLRFSRKDLDDFLKRQRIATVEEINSHKRRLV